MHDPRRRTPKERLNEFRHRIVVFGTRGFDDAILFDHCLKKFLRDQHLDAEEVKAQIVFLTGMTPNTPEILAYAWAKKHDYSWSEFHPDWDEVEIEGAVVRYREGRPYNAIAGFWRDEEMAEVCTHGVSFYDGVSSGTQDMIDRVANQGNPCATYLVTTESDEDYHGEKPLGS